MRTYSITTALALGLVLAVGTACGSSHPTARVRTPAVPTGVDTAVVRVDTRGGYTSLDAQLAIVPEVSVFGDGRVIVTGPVIRAVSAACVAEPRHRRARPTAASRAWWNEPIAQSCSDTRSTSGSRG